MRRVLMTGGAVRTATAALVLVGLLAGGGLTLAGGWHPPAGAPRGGVRPLFPHGVRLVLPAAGGSDAGGGGSPSRAERLLRTGRGPAHFFRRASHHDLSRSAMTFSWPASEGS